MQSRRYRFRRVRPRAQRRDTRGRTATSSRVARSNWALTHIASTTAKRRSDTRVEIVKRHQQSLGGTHELLTGHLLAGRCDSASHERVQLRVIAPTMPPHIDGRRPPEAGCPPEAVGSWSSGPVD